MTSGSILCQYFQYRNDFKKNDYLCTQTIEYER